MRLQGDDGETQTCYSDEVIPSATNILEIRASNNCYRLDKWVIVNGEKCTQIIFPRKSVRLDVAVFISSFSFITAKKISECIFYGLCNSYKKAGSSLFIQL